MTQKDLLLEALLSGENQRALGKAYHNDPTFKFQVDMLIEMMLVTVRALCSEVPARQDQQKQMERLMAWYSFRDQPTVKE